MASIDPVEAYPPKWLSKDNADQLIRKLRYILTILSIGYELVGEEKKREVVWRFKEISQGLITKRAHHTAAVALYGADSEGWLGKRVQIRRNPKYGTGVGETGLVVLPPPGSQVPAPVPAEPPSDDLVVTEYVDDQDVPIE